jgi:hypothetical protein
LFVKNFGEYQRRVRKCVESSWSTWLSYDSVNAGSCLWFIFLIFLLWLKLIKQSETFVWGHFWSSDNLMATCRWFSWGSFTTWWNTIRFSSGICRRENDWRHFLVCKKSDALLPNRIQPPSEGNVISLSYCSVSFGFQWHFWKCLTRQMSSLNLVRHLEYPRLQSFRESTFYDDDHCVHILLLN